VGNIPLLKVQGSSIAPQIDALFWVITLNAVFFTVAIFAAIGFLSWRYRRGSKVDRSNPPQYNHIVEIVWTVGPLLIALGIFAWSAIVYMEARHYPKNAMEIWVTGKQWMWKIQHPEGRWENNELHVPLGKPIQLTMTSEDVIHSFFVPEFRLKQDVIPGQYTRLSFTPTKIGTFQLLCAEFCGSYHSTMVGTVTVMDPAEYEKWLNTGLEGGSMAAAGQKLFIAHGCNGCHGPASSVKAPMLDGIYNKLIPVQIPVPGKALADTPATTLVADQRYIHDAIVLPEKEVAAGYQPIMPTFRNRLTEYEIAQLVAYIRSLGNNPGVPGNTPGGKSRQPLSSDEYKARIGFVPGNLNKINQNASQNGAGGGNGAVRPNPAGGPAGAGATDSDNPGTNVAPTAGSKAGSTGAGQPGAGSGPGLNNSQGGSPDGFGGGPAPPINEDSSFYRPNGGQQSPFMNERKPR
jgi:cytochrome c oxidase subunit 2